jgi:uncharacterized protein (DUF58 family)
MLTNRGSTILFIAGSTLVGGLLSSHAQTSLIALSLIMWILVHWLGILIATFRRPVLSSASRTVNGSSDDGLVLTLGNQYKIRTTWKPVFLLPGTLIEVSEALPPTFRVESGSSSLLDRGLPSSTRQLNYVLIPETCGRFDLPGLAVEVRDIWGFFLVRRFVPCFQRATILPFMIRAESTRTVVKAANVQTVQGQHAWRRAGVSAELLGIREYRSGDPPRTIAWKATARTGEMMSREFEMEVPVRSTVIAGLSAEQFQGWPETTVGDRVITATASLARLLLADRDPVALMLATGDGSTRLPHAGGQRQLIRILHRLLEVTPGYPVSSEANSESLVDAVLETASIRFPHLISQAVTGTRPVRFRILPGRRRKEAKKRRVAMLVAQKLGLPPGMEIRLMANERALSGACLSFLQRFHVLTRNAGNRPGFESAGSHSRLTANLVASLLKCCRMARDQELVILVAAIPARQPDRASLLDAIKVLRAAGHRVMLVHVPVSDVSIGPIIDPDAARILASIDPVPLNDDSTFAEFRRLLASFGVTCSEIGHPSMMRRVAIEVDLLRSGRSGGVRGRGVAAW